MSSHVFRVHRPVHHLHPLILRLSSGFRRFQHRWYHPEEPLFHILKQGQNPLALVIACSDSRVDPVLLTDSRPGDLFVVRNVANLVPPYAPDNGTHGVSAALEYAVQHLKVQDIIVMGHACCGGIHALVAANHQESTDEFIGPWVSVAQRALEKVDELMPGADVADRARACEMWSVRFSLDNLKTFPWIRHAVSSGRLNLHGWYFDLQSGELLEYDDKEERFRPLVGRPHLHDGYGTSVAGRH
jgi:carbonic anhydrase